MAACLPGSPVTYDRLVIINTKTATICSIAPLSYMASSITAAVLMLTGIGTAADCHASRTSYTWCLHDIAATSMLTGIDAAAAQRYFRCVDVLTPVPSCESHSHDRVL